MNTRACRVCRLEKPLTAFARYNQHGGRRHECIVCMNLRREKYSSGEWVSHARPRTVVVNLKAVYAGPHHCWVCRRSVKSREPFALCRECLAINWEKPE